MPGFLNCKEHAVLLLLSYVSSISYFEEMAAGYKTILNSFQIGDSRFEGRERIRYTRDQLLQLHQVSRVFY